MNTYRLIVFSGIVIILSLCEANESKAQEMLQNPVVAEAQVGDFKHGTYPSLGSRTHAGIDLAAACGSTVQAFADGVVIDLIADASDVHFNTVGFMVIVEHPATLMGEPFYSAYFHLQEPPSVQRGVEVRGGHSMLGKVGDTGVAYSCQVHFEMRRYEGRFSPAWQNLFGEGNQSTDPHFFEAWDDPLDLFSVYPDGLRHTWDQEEEEVLPGLTEPAEEEVFMIVENMPQLIGGLASVQKAVDYPETAISRKIEGRVFVQFVVNQEGKVEDAVVVRGIGYGCDEAALSAVRQAQFKPGRQRGEPVKVKMSLPVTFKLK